VFNEAATVVKPRSDRVSASNRSGVQDAVQIPTPEFTKI
jgi:hypothetical protein